MINLFLWLLLIYSCVPSIDEKDDFKNEYGLLKTRAK
jgi:hypothetical protein